MRMDLKVTRLNYSIISLLPAGHHSSGGSHHSGSGGSVPLTGQSGSGSASLVPPISPAIAPEVQQPQNSGFTFKEVLVPARSHLITMGATNKYLDSSGAMHIVGEITNNGTTTATVFSMTASIYGANNQILGIDYSSPTPPTISPGQSASFDFIVGGSGSADGVSDPSVITMVKYTLS